MFKKWLLVGTFALAFTSISTFGARADDAFKVKVKLEEKKQYQEKTSGYVFVPDEHYLTISIKNTSATESLVCKIYAKQKKSSSLGSCDPILEDIIEPGDAPKGSISKERLVKLLGTTDESYHYYFAYLSGSSGKVKLVVKKLQ